MKLGSWTLFVNNFLQKECFFKSRLFKNDTITYTENKHEDDDEIKITHGKINRKDEDEIDENELSLLNLDLNLCKETSDNLKWKWKFTTVAFYTITSTNLCRLSCEGCKLMFIVTERRSASFIIF